MDMGLIAKLENETSPNLRSHAYLLVSNDGSEIDQAIDFLVKREKCLKEDISSIEFEVKEGKAGEIKAEQVRSFLHNLNLSAYGSVRIGIIRNCEKLNVSSANILLKTLEEPPQNVILILTASTLNILPTIQSRCRIYRVNREMADCHTFSYEKMLQSDLAENFSEIEKLVKSGETEIFLNGLERFLENLIVKRLDPRSESVLEEVLETKKRIRNNANQRLALENLVIKAREVVL